MEIRQAATDTRKLFFMYRKNPAVNNTFEKLLNVGAAVNREGTAARISESGFIADTTIQ